jgi:hypothetical protein
MRLTSTKTALWIFQVRDFCVDDAFSCMFDMQCWLGSLRTRGTCMFDMQCWLGSLLTFFFNMVLSRTDQWVVGALQRQPRRQSTGSVRLVRLQRGRFHHDGRDHTVFDRGLSRLVQDFKIHPGQFASVAGRIGGRHRTSPILDPVSYPPV